MAERTQGMNQEPGRPPAADRLSDIREQVRERGAQVQERAQEMGTQVRDWAQEKGSRDQRRGARGHAAGRTIDVAAR